MPRRSIKKEPLPESRNLQQSPKDAQPFHPVSSGDTIVDDDVVMSEDLLNGHGEAQASTAMESKGHPGSLETIAPCGGFEILSRGVKELVQAVQNLRHLGVEDLVLPLPKIVVVGDQSTGKSSLIEGISEIKVPRRSGCPLEINLSQSSTPQDQWVGKVSLYKKYAYEGSQGRSSLRGSTATARTEGATKSRPLGPWIAQDPEDTLFATANTKEELADILEWAQLATLNPGSPYDSYIPTSGSFKADRSNQVKFSPNVVRIDINGPDLPNLSFYDLPGVINVSDIAEEGYLVDLVRNLVKEYIRADNCINLLTLPMTDDPANSSASMLLRKEHAESRTIGVLTKPDRVQESESIEQWVQILNGDRFHLGHGYFIVMNNPDTNVSHATARTQERQFFDRDDPWGSTLKHFRERFGTVNLQTELSHKLTAQIRANLPYFTQQVQRKAEQIEAALKTIPEPPSGNLPLKIHERINQFESKIRKDIDGGVPGHPFQMEWRSAAESFRKTLADSRPLMSQPNPRPSIRQTIEQLTSTPSRHNTVSDAIALDSDDDNIVTPKTALSSSSRRKRVSQAESQITPSKRTRMSDIPLHIPHKDVVKTAFSKSFSLPEIGRILKEAHVGLPGQIDPKAINRIICSSLEVWSEPLDDFLDQSIQMCQGIVSERIKEALSHWPQTLLQTKTEEICASFFDRLTAEVKTIVGTIYKHELQQPMMLDDAALNTANQKALAMLISRRRESRAVKFLDEQEVANERTPNRQGRAERLAKITDAQLGPDPFAQEVLAMSFVKGYYDCAFSRFADVVCQTISCDLLGVCRDQLAEELKEKLGVRKADAQDRCEELLAINQEQEKRRRQLLKERATLEKAQKRLHELADKVPGVADVASEGRAV